MKKLLTPLILSIVLGSSAYGATVVLSGLSFGPIQINAAGLPNDFIAVPQWSNPTTLAIVVCPAGSTLTLNSVKLAFTGGISAKGSVHNKNTANASSVFKLDFSGPFTLSTPSISSALTVTPNLVLAPPNIALAAGATTAFGPSGAGASGSLTITTVSGIADFLGTGTAKLPLTTQVVSGLGATTAVELLFPTSADGVFAQAMLDVTYDYTCTPGAIIPEPKVYGLIGAALSLGVLGYRQYRSKKA